MLQRVDGVRCEVQELAQGDGVLEEREPDSLLRELEGVHVGDDREARSQAERGDEGDVSLDERRSVPRFQSVGAVHVRVSRHASEVASSTGSLAQRSVVALLEPLGRLRVVDP